MPIVILDTNLLVLLVVGLTSRSLIEKHKRLRAYSKEDFDLLMETVGEATIAVTPNTLTETSNLLRQIDGPARDRISAVLADLIKRAEERYVQSREAVDAKEFKWLGLTDAGLLAGTNDTETLLTADLGLFLAAGRRGKRALNFNHMRTQAGLLP